MADTTYERLSRRLVNRLGGVLVGRRSGAECAGGSLYVVATVLAVVLSACGSGATPIAVPSGSSVSVSASSGSGQFSIKQIISEPISQDTIETISFSPDGHHIALGAGDGVVAVYPLEATGADDVPRSQKLHATFVSSLAWSPDGKQVLTVGTDGSVRAWDEKTFAISFRFNVTGPSHPTAVWSPEGQKIAVAEGRDRIEIFDALGQGPAEDTFVLPGITQALLWPSDNLLIGSNDQGTVAFFQRGNPNPVRTYVPQPSRKAVSSLALSPSDPLLAVGYEDGSIVLLDPSTAKVVREFPKGRNIGSLAWSPNGKVLAASSLEFAVNFWDPKGIQLAKADIGYDMNGVSWSPDGRYVTSASDDHSFKVWSVTPPQTPSQPSAPPASYMRR